MGDESGSGKTGSLNNRPCWSKNKGKLSSVTFYSVHC
jgi:hypothetical protein